MPALFKAFLEICLLRRGPSGLPASHFLLWLSLAGYVLSSFALTTPSYPLFTALLASLTDGVVLLGLTLSVLAMQGLTGRLSQTLAALAGSGTLLNLTALPPTVWWISAHNGRGDTGAPEVLILLLVIWSLAVMAHILREALSTRLMPALVVAGIFYWISVSVQTTLFPISL